MAKLTATEFKALKDDTARYSAYDDAMNASDAARSAQSDALVAHEQAETDKAALAKSHADALAAKDAERTKAVTDATTPLQVQIDTLTTMVTDRDMLAKRVDSLTITNASLSSQLAGSKGSRTIHLSAVDETVLVLEATAMNVPVDELLAGKVSAWLNDAARAKQSDVFTLAMERFFSSDPKTQGQVLGLMGLLDYAALPPESRLKALNAFALDAFRGLDAKSQTQVFGLLGLT